MQVFGFQDLLTNTIDFNRDSLPEWTADTVASFPLQIRSALFPHIKFFCRGKTLHFFKYKISIMFSVLLKAIYFSKITQAFTFSGFIWTLFYSW